jgi:hypothetical protein
VRRYFAPFCPKSTKWIIGADALLEEASGDSISSILDSVFDKKVDCKSTSLSIYMWGRIISMEREVWMM